MLRVFLPKDAECGMCHDKLFFDSYENFGVLLFFPVTAQKTLHVACVMKTLSLIATELR